MEKKEDSRWIMKEHKNVSMMRITKSILCNVFLINLFQQFEYTCNTSDKSTGLEKFIKVIHYKKNNISCINMCVSMCK